MRILFLCLFACLCPNLFGCCEGEADNIFADLGQPADLSSPLLDANGPVPLQPPVVCGSELPGPPLKADVIEAQPGYAAELAALDLTRVSDPFDYREETKLAIMVINYMLGRSQGTSISQKEALQKGGIGRAILGAAAKGTMGHIDFAFLRRGLYYFYPCSRPLPADLIELRRRYGDYRSWPGQEIPCSRPKNGPRRVYEAPELGVYVTETVVGGQVRETEVLLSALRTDGQLDFAAYTADGLLSDRSSFATAGGGVITTAAPYTCISCHLDSASGTISRRFPSGTGAGCREPLARLQPFHGAGYLKLGETWESDAHR